MSHKNALCVACSLRIAADQYWSVILGKCYHMTASAGDAAMTFYTTVHLWNPSIAQKQGEVAGGRDGYLPVSGRVTQFNLLALSTIISTPRQDEKRTSSLLSPWLHLFLLYLFTGQVSFVFIKAKAPYMLTSKKNDIGYTEVWLQELKLRGQGPVFLWHNPYVN